MKRILAMLLSVICVLSFTCVSTYADEKSEDEEKAASIAESYLSAAAKNMWLYESNNLAEHTIQELVDTSGNSLLSDMSTDVNTQKILSSIRVGCPQHGHLAGTTFSLAQQSRSRFSSTWGMI